MTDTLRFTDAVIDKLQEVMAFHGFTVPVRVISDAFRTTAHVHQAPEASGADAAPYKAGDRAQLKSGKVAVVKDCWNAVGGWRVLAQVIGEERTPHRGMIDFNVKDLTPAPPTSAPADESGAEARCAWCGNASSTNVLSHKPTCRVRTHPHSDFARESLTPTAEPRAAAQGVRPAIVGGLIESARCLGVAQAKDDANAVKYWEAQVADYSARLQPSGAAEDAARLELPSAQAWLDSHCSVATRDWQRGWDAAREAQAARRARGEG